MNLELRAAVRLLKQCLSFRSICSGCVDRSQKGEGDLLEKAVNRSDRANKKADVIAPARVFDHIGLFTDEPPGMSGLPFI